MIQTQDTDRQFEGAEYRYSKEDFDEVAAFALQHFGLCLPETKMSMVYTRLSRRLRERRVKDFRSYRRLLSAPSEAEERQALLSALTTNVTRFFREPHHFDFLREEVLPPLVTKARSGDRVRLWSAGCSCGQEPYSMAMCVLELCPEAANLDIRILGTDIDPEVINCAQRAVYSEEELDSIPDRLREQNVSVSEENSMQGRVGAKARGLVRFGVLNLIEEFPFTGPFDVIFCRNVTIYFDKATQNRVWKKLEAVMAPGSYLFAGHSERLSGSARDTLRSVGITTYIKSNQADI